MKKLLPPAMLIALFAMPAAGSEESEAMSNLKAYPPAAKGMSRFVLTVPPQGDESAAEVELQVGRTLQTDAHNRYFFAGKLEEETIKGWGFSRYVVKKLGPMSGTRMGVDPKAPKVARFITLGGEPYKVRYNSRLPIVVYVPEGAEVRYRIWRAEPEVQSMTPG